MDEIASNGNACRASGEVEGHKMLRTIKIGAIVVLSCVSVVPAARAGTLTWGIFRENASSISESLRNCWAQAMVSGQTINGELMAQNLTQQRAEIELQVFARRGLCAAERSGPSWSARGEGRTVFGESEGGGSSFGPNGNGSDWSNAGRFGGPGSSPHAGPMGGGR